MCAETVSASLLPSSLFGTGYSQILPVFIEQENHATNLLYIVIDSLKDPEIK